MKSQIKSTLTVAVAAILSINVSLANDNIKGFNVIDPDLGIQYVMSDGDNTMGIAITRVFSNSVGSALGLQNNDILIGIGNQPLFAENFEDVLATYEAGDDVLLRVNRDGKYREISIKMPAINGSSTTAGNLGVKVRPLGKTNKVGAKVKYVEKGGSAYLSGVQYGDILLGVNNQPVVGENLYELISAHTAGEVVELRIQRQGELHIISTILGK